MGCHKQYPFLLFLHRKQFADDGFLIFLYLCTQDKWGESSIFWVKRQYLRLAYTKLLFSPSPGGQEHEEKNTRNNPPVALALPGTKER
jgi:hypothetical protein